MDEHIKGGIKMDKANVTVRVLDDEGNIIEGVGFYAVKLKKDERGYGIQTKLAADIGDAEYLIIDLISSVIDTIADAMEVDNMIDKVNMGAEFMNNLRDGVAQQQAEQAVKRMMGGLN